MKEQDIMKRYTHKDAAGNWVLSSSAFNWPQRGLPVHLSGPAVDRFAELEDLAEAGNVNKDPASVEKELELN